MLMYMLTVIPVLSSKLFTVHSSTSKATTMARRKHPWPNNVMVFTIVSLGRHRLPQAVSAVVTNVPSHTLYHASPPLAAMHTGVFLASLSSSGTGGTRAEYTVRVRCFTPLVGLVIEPDCVSGPALSSINRIMVEGSLTENALP
jgi:hypothetical protein